MVVATLPILSVPGQEDISSSAMTTVPVVFSLVY